MVKTGKIARGAILGVKGGVWATSPGYTVSVGCFETTESCLTPLIILPLVQLSKPEQDFLVKVAFTQPGEAQGKC
jgi:hypothetical protein